ncbi:MAG: hypothetical protein PHF19_08410, partial [Synergistales bacterium]|nr:hypothetical protein [Synergistales bacterium]
GIRRGGAPLRELLPSGRPSRVGKALPDSLLRDERSSRVGKTLPDGLLRESEAFRFREPLSGGSRRQLKGNGSGSGGRNSLCRGFLIPAGRRGLFALFVLREAFPALGKEQREEKALHAVGVALLRRGFPLARFGHGGLSFRRGSRLFAPLSRLHAGAEEGGKDVALFHPSRLR